MADITVDRAGGGTRGCLIQSVGVLFHRQTAPPRTPKSGNKIKFFLFRPRSSYRYDDNKLLAQPPSSAPSLGTERRSDSAQPDVPQLLQPPARARSLLPNNRKQSQERITKNIYNKLYDTGAILRALYTPKKAITLTRNSGRPSGSSASRRGPCRRRRATTRTTRTTRATGASRGTRSGRPERRRAGW